MTANTFDDLYAQFFNLSLEMLCIAGFDGYFKHLNPAWEKTLGYTIAELSAQPFIEFVHPDDRKATLAEAQKLTTGINTISFKNRYRCQDGTYKWLSWNATSHQEKQLLLATAHDITPQKHHEEILQRSTETLSKLAESLRELHKLSTTSFKSYQELFLAYLKAGCGFFQMPTGIISKIEGEVYTIEAVESDMTSLAVGDTFALNNTYCQSVVEQQKTVILAHVGQMPHMRSHPVYQNLRLESYLSAPVYVNGRLFGTLNFSSQLPRPQHFASYEVETLELMAESLGRFLTVQQAEQEEQKMFAALHQSEEMFRSLFESATVGIVIINEDGQIKLSNNALERLFGYRHGELLEQSIEVLLPLANRRAHVKERRRFFASPRLRPMGTGLALSGQHQNGSQFPVEVSLGTIQIHGETLAMGFVADVSRQVQAEETLQQQTKDLARSNEELRKFAYAISHDLRAPLRALYTYSQFLQEDYGDVIDEDGQEYIKGIAESAQHMEALVVGLLEYGRIGRDSKTLSWVSLQDLLVKLIKQLNLRQLAELHVPAELPVIQAQPFRLEQIFNNLLTNAVKYRRPDVPPVITIACEERNNYWELSVIDNGIGIDEKYHQKIFGIFQRLHTNTEYEGTGIGLAIVQKAVEDQGGAIWLTSQPGLGSTFTFTIPKT